MTGTKARYYLLYSGQILAGVIPHRSPPLELHDSRGYVDRAVTLTVNSLWSSRLPTSVARIPFFILHGAPCNRAWRIAPKANQAVTGASRETPKIPIWLADRLESFRIWIAEVLRVPRKALSHHTLQDWHSTAPETDDRACFFDY